MRLQPLRLGQGGDGLLQPQQPLVCDHLDADLLGEVVHIEARENPGISGGGQHMIGAAGIVACRHWRVPAQKDGAGIPDGPEGPHGIGGDDL